MPTLHNARVVTISMLFSDMKGNSKRNLSESSKWLPLGSRKLRQWALEDCSFFIMSLVEMIDYLGV